MSMPCQVPVLVSCHPKRGQFVILCSSNCCKLNHLGCKSAFGINKAHFLWQMNLSFRSRKSRVLVVPQVTLVRALWCSNEAHRRFDAQPIQIGAVDMQWNTTVEGNIYKPTTINHSLVLGERTRSSREQWSQVPINIAMETKFLNLITVLTTIFVGDLIRETSSSICKLCWCSRTSITCEEANSSLSRIDSSESDEIQPLNVTYMWVNLE